MPPPIPPEPLGISLNDTSLLQLERCKTVDVFIDLCCPFSKKMFHTIHSTVNSDSSNANLINSTRFRLFLVPQPWHPQSSLMAEAVLAVYSIDNTKVVDYINLIYTNQEAFFDENVSMKSRTDLYHDLAVLAEMCHVEKSMFLSKLIINPTSNTVSATNCGNSVTQCVKWYVKYHRSVGVHVTPTVFINNIEASHISSSWMVDQWLECLSAI